MGMIRTGDYGCLEIFIKSLEEKAGYLCIRKGKEEWQKYPAGEYHYAFWKIPLECNAEYEAKLCNCETSVAYLSETEDIMEKGVRFLEYIPTDGIGAGEWAETEDMGAWYDTPNREQYHFNAYRNWINDPNGLCYYKGYYHLYYQANPHGQKWDLMYWGHAVSRDLVHWIHLPYALQPQEEILAQRDLKGGAFSGSAVPLENKIVFYLTRHIGPQEEREENTVQYQTMVTSKDSIHFEEEIKILEKPDDTFSFNFRDPKVYYLDGCWQMVIAAKVNEIPALVRYRSADMKKWEYDGVLLEERTAGVYTFECPDFYPLDGRFVATGSWMCYEDEQHRYQPTFWYVGDYKDGVFVPENRGMYDFGSNFYAVQSFENDGRRIAVGWTADFYQEHMPEEKGSYGAMAIPREISVQNGKLYQKPVKEIYQLCRDVVCDISGHNLSLEHLNRNCYYARIDFTGEVDFQILLGRSETGEIWLVRKGTEVRIRTKGVKSQDIDFTARVEKLEKAEVFVDRRLVEVYLNDGEAVGTKLFYQGCADGVFKAEFEKEEEVERIQVCKMESAWGLR